MCIKSEDIEIEQQGMVLKAWFIKSKKCISYCSVTFRSGCFSITFANESYSEIKTNSSGVKRT